ncbi:hypothetical protein AAG570_011360 [Ranatra chinensis]|uniref:Vitellogenin n=1 Tax=Ranatra chinensis TaxID=642074 RepID=A0ABD0YKI8_9HEMI
MCWLDVEDWQNLFSTVALGTSYRQETIQHFFWELVPQVGTKWAALFIKDLVRTGRVKGLSAGRLLVNFPFFLRDPSEELLTQYEELLNLDESIGQDVKSAAVLGFASLVHKTCISNCITDTIDRYAKLYLDKFTESTTYEDKMLYLQGLSNMELTQALEFFMPIITGQATSNRHIRFLATWATLHTVQTSPNKIFEVYWPIFSNRSESLELRVSAFTLLISSNPSPARFFSLYWFMQSEPSELLYNFYYTTIQSLSSTSYPCYSQLGKAAAKLARFVPPKSKHWTTGNYILDFEDRERDYGGLLQVLLIASEFNGLPNVFIFMAEQHALGQTRHYSLYLKVEGLYDTINHELQNISRTDDGNNKINKVLQLLLKLEIPLTVPEDLHLEFIFKIDGKVVISQYSNQTSFNNWKDAVKRLSSKYFEFSVNFQSLNFPSLLSIWRPTDLGTPVLVQIKSTDLISARGSINQENGGYTRNAELDLRYSWNAISTLKSYDPFNNKWHGAERCRNLHIRLPFATQLIVQADNAVYKVTAVRHRGFVAGSRLGMVWHASSRLISHSQIRQFPLNISDEWTMDSEDLGARLGASVFDCSNPDTLPEALHLLKGAFLANNKNYHMIPGGVALLGLISMRDNLRIIPTGSSCGVMLYFSPLLTQVEPVILYDGTHVSLKMTRQDGLLWEVKVGFKKLHDSNDELSFKLYHAPSVSVTAGHIWRVIQLEGAFIVPSRMSGVFNPPAAVTGYTFVSWGDAAPSNADKASMLDLKVIPGGRNDTKPLICADYTPKCLQAASDLAARQTATLQYANLPTWLKMAAHALFPEHIQTEGTHTQVTFAYPVALLPWNTKGLCAINDNSVLTLDNATLSMASTECYSLAVADCSNQAQFSILAKTTAGLMVAKIYCSTDEIELFPEKGIIKVQVNGNILDDVKQEYNHTENNKSQLMVRMRAEGVIEVELRSGVVLQHYNTTIIILIPGKFRGHTCGICGDFNGDTNNEPKCPFTMC